MAWIAQSLSFHIFWERCAFMGDKVSALPDLEALRVSVAQAAVCFLRPLSYRSDRWRCSFIISCELMCSYLKNMWAFCPSPHLSIWGITIKCSFSASNPVAWKCIVNTNKYHSLCVIIISYEYLQSGLAEEFKATVVADRASGEKRRDCPPVYCSEKCLHVS